MRKNIVRVSDELLELINDPSKITPEHRFCLWCGMVRVDHKKPCEICGNYGEKFREQSRVYVEIYCPSANGNAPAPKVNGNNRGASRSKKSS
jgi:hypothetical protein